MTDDSAESDLKSLARRRRKSLFLVAVPVLAILLVMVASSIISGFATPEDIGVKDGKLGSCPDSPNCVSTFATDEEHAAQPIPFNGDADHAMSRLKEIIDGWPRATIVAESGNYIHAEFRSRLFRFIDDVEFLVDPEKKVIQYRSASRVGYSDLGANRNRMEKLANAFAGKDD